MIHTLLVLLAPAPSFTAPAPAVLPIVAGLQDPLVKKAVTRIAEVEKAEAALANGDATEADKLLSRLAWAEKRLNAVVQQGTKEWKDADARHDAVKAKIEKKKAAKGSGGKTPPKAGGGKTPPKKKVGGNTPPKPAPAVDFQKLSRLNDSISRSIENLKIVPIKLLLDDSRVRGLQSELSKYDTELATFPASDANVKIVTGNLKIFRDMVQGGLDRIAADKAAAPKIEERLDTLFDAYSDEDFPLRVDPPYREGQLLAWARELQQRRDVKIPNDKAWLQSVAANVVTAERVQSAFSSLDFTESRKVQEAEMYVKDGLDGFAADAVRIADFILETDTKDRNQMLSRVLGKGRFDENVERLRTGLHRVKMAELLDRELKRKDAPDRAKQAATVEKAIEHLGVIARVGLSEVRMPKAASTDAELLKIAAATLKKDKYEVGAWERLVINSDVRELQRREAWLDPGTVRATISFYDYKWKQFQVTTAEKVGDEIWLFANTLKFYESGDRTTPVGEWILSQRMELTPILAENVEK